ncbi:hypothetical protein Baya_15582 [Bagarius yarrelli]|uniref:Uncharacterized protein n=1 Tax=Bagarius yarrelli TaxID=175774 RepID=A0A556VC56_BAGYA|nr:hypothetical protein Baya_15582 [Bagarius yarrelli]
MKWACLFVCVNLSFDSSPALSNTWHVSGSRENYWKRFNPVIRKRTKIQQELNPQLNIESFSLTLIHTPANKGSNTGESTQQLEAPFFHLSRMSTAGNSCINKHEQKKLSSAHRNSKKPQPPGFIRKISDTIDLDGLLTCIIGYYKVCNPAENLRQTQPSCEEFLIMSQSSCTEIQWEISISLNAAGEKLLSLREEETPLGRNLWVKRGNSYVSSL